MLGDYERVLEFEPEDIRTCANLALVMLGRNDEALASLDVMRLVAAADLLVVYVTALHQLVRNERAKAGSRSAS